MEYWSSPFINGDSSSSFIYPFQNPDNFSGNQENKCFSSGTLVQTQGGPLHEHYYTPPAMVERIYGEASNSFNGYEQKKKKKMTTEQIKLLERNFREDMKLDSDRKMNLCKELGLQPRQIAVWFQNRKARWKTKQLEHLYESLRQEFAVVSREKKLLQEELIQLKSMMRESGSSEKQQTWEKACSEAISAQFQFN